MNLIYSKKENPYLYFVLALLILVLFIVGVYFVNYYLWYVFAPIVLLVIKGAKIMKCKEVPVIKLNEEGLTVLKENQENDFYAYSDISEIQIHSNLLNGYLKIKNNSKKIHLDTVAINSVKQEEIVKIVTSKLIK